MLDQIKIK